MTGTYRMDVPSFDWEVLRFWQRLSDRPLQVRTVGSCPTTPVCDHVRHGDAGTVVTSVGVSAGIDMSLHLVHRLEPREMAHSIARAMEYAWQPTSTV
ncbi:hypothetical protein [Streptomyces sp. NPDC046939]|uniref:hypothetical protein n=1 Tax=Streptomyces sp. NPDC046939 TaxID=3155376 RepID=UPI0033E322C1